MTRRNILNVILIVLFLIIAIGLLLGFIQPSLKSIEIGVTLILIDIIYNRLK